MVDGGVGEVGRLLSIGGGPTGLAAGVVVEGGETDVWDEGDGVGGTGKIGVVGRR